jgi:hypothetical protein
LRTRRFRRKKFGQCPENPKPWLIFVSSQDGKLLSHQFRFAEKNAVQIPQNGATDRKLVQKRGREAGIADHAWSLEQIIDLLK